VVHAIFNYFYGMKKFIKQLLRPLYNANIWLLSRFDQNYILEDTPIAQKVNHSQWQEYIYNMANHSGMRILEIGSREVTGESQARKKLWKAQYTGFDYYPGKNVDVVGDAHKLSSYFTEKESFDVIYSSACFEHFAMPWMVAQEIAKMLKVGGIVFIETHFSFSSHERPWHFFQFSDMALKTLFNPAMGFECLEAGFSNPIVGRFSSLSSPYLRNKPVRGLFCHSEFLGKKLKSVPNFNWNTLKIEDVVGNDCYPTPNE
jgi:SAM-dependent methyltransferase